MDTEFVKYLASLGVGGIIAGFMFILYRKDMARAVEQWKGQSELWLEQNKVLIMVVKENTAAFTKNTDIMKAFHYRLDSEQADRDEERRQRERRSDERRGEPRHGE
jgi:hypothetical protein